MPNLNHNPKMDTFTFRIEANLKAEFVRLASSHDKAAGEILRDFIRELLGSKRKADFISEAHRQSKLLAATSSNANSDEAKVLSELDAAFDELTSQTEWNQG